MSKQPNVINVGPITLHLTAESLGMLMHEWNCQRTSSFDDVVSSLLHEVARGKEIAEIEKAQAEGLS